MRLFGLERDMPRSAMILNGYRCYISYDILLRTFIYSRYFVSLILDVDNCIDTHMLIGLANNQCCNDKLCGHRFWKLSIPNATTAQNLKTPI